MKNNIENKVIQVIDDPFDVQDVDIVPDIEDKRLTFGNTGLRFKATVLYIDMRGSTALLNKHNRTTTAKLHMAYFHTIVTIANANGGSVRSFNGDGMLVFFQGNTKQVMSTAVKSAMQMVYMLTHSDSKVRQKLEKYSALDFGIGIDHGNILCTKAGKSGSNNRDLIWLGNAVNKSVKIGDKLSSPNRIGISNYVHYNLLDWAKFSSKKDFWGNPISMWEQDSHSYNDSWEDYYYTNYYWEVI
ncbi:adenylate/guanylate cyclase domain-containing protein [Rheinheimera aquimaris]|uniref:adenylate/guanylate cyclase domain-containing protein n=1 Tax=Rheinheimera aquimaris TaxID=412437 RepID=UPI001E3DC2D0|nr:adenylate/guanylate cyclase domain-containing protein [Rheinheimera aquimaris]MCD1598194.1 adenylate/guanylate cyclase domain-containing protein [Rheinheimera aquimaris]